MTLDLLVLTDQRDGTLKVSSLESISEARRLVAKAGGGKVVVGLLGHGLSAAVEGVRAFGPDLVLVADDAKLKTFSAQAYSAVAARMLERLSEPKAVLAPATALGRELLPRLAVEVGGTIAPDVTEIAPREGGGLIAMRPIFGGRATLAVDLPTLPCISLRPNAFASEPRSNPSTAVEPFALPALPATAEAVVVERTVVSRGDTPELTEAPIIVSGGRGLKGPENFVLIEKLAKVLGAGIGASRAVVDAGWRPSSEQVGQTGKTVSPNLYVACGISGAIQHLVGMSSSRCIVAINKDPAAPIFKVANYGVAGDALTILPALTTALARSKGVPVP